MERALDPALVRTGSFSAEFAEQQTAELLALPDRPTAIIAGGVNMLPGVLRAIRSTRLRIPQDISVVCSTNSELAQLVTPSITELHVRYADIGREASALMMGRLEGTIEGPRAVVRQRKAGKGRWTYRKASPAVTWRHAASAMPRALRPVSAAVALAAVPSSERLRMPCRMAASLNIL